jgi:hypothetical protein
VRNSPRFRLDDGFGGGFDGGLSRNLDHFLGRGGFCHHNRGFFGLDHGGDSVGPAVDRIGCLLDQKIAPADFGATTIWP